MDEFYLVREAKTGWSGRAFRGRPGGEGGIRTRGGCLAPTRFPGVRLKPLIHLSGDDDLSRAMSPARPPGAPRPAHRSRPSAPSAGPALRPPEARRNKPSPTAPRRADCTRTARRRRGNPSAAKACRGGPRRSSPARPNLCHTEQSSRSLLERKMVEKAVDHARLVRRAVRASPRSGEARKRMSPGRRLPLLGDTAALASTTSRVVEPLARSDLSRGERRCCG